MARLAQGTGGAIEAFDAIALRESERGLVPGGTGSGKSTLCEQLIAHFINENKKGLVLIADSKPRFRAEWRINGLSAKPLYKKWKHGPFVPGSARLELGVRGFGIKEAMLNGHRIFIAQTEYPGEFPLILLAVDAFFRMSRADRPQLLYTDETLDFYSKSGHSLVPKLDPILRTVRAGRERGVGFLGGTQRLRGFPPQFISELTKLYLFRLDVEDDVEHLWEMGIPPDTNPPEDDKLFYYWDKKTRKVPPKLYRLNLDGKPPPDERAAPESPAPSPPPAT